MSTLAVVVSKHGVAQSQATVQLDGPGGTQSQATNLAGNATFNDLPPGRYVVNAAHQADFLGNGFMTLGPGASRVIHIKYPKTLSGDNGAKTCAINVHVHIYLQGIEIAAPSAMVAVFRGSEPSGIHREVVGGVARFVDLQAGEYSVSAWTLGGTTLRGTADVILRSGATAPSEVTIVLYPKQGPDPVSCDYEFSSIDELLTRIQVLEAEIVKIQHQIEAMEAFADHVVSECLQKGRAGGGIVKGEPKDAGKRWRDGDVGFCASGLAKVKINETQVIPRLQAEVEGKKAVIEVLKEAIKCKRHNPTEI